MNQNVLRSAVTVFLFWWIALAVYGLFWTNIEWSYAWQATTTILLLSALGVVIGVGLVWLHIRTGKQAHRAMLASESVRGLFCTIGEVPMIAKEPGRAPDLPDLTCVPDIPKDFFDKWFAKYEKTHPAHVELMRVLLRIFHFQKDLPATHVAGGHGGRTLLQHSLLAGYFMDKLGQTWTYSGLRDRTGKRVVLKLRDESYEFERNDPLIALIGVAHDIGKIEAYIFDDKDKTKVVGIHHEHDLTGARMIARLPEAWAIPDEDRQAMFLAIAHYHHPMELPLSPDRRAVDDRTIALMELLIKTDYVASRMEADGRVPADQEYEQAGGAAATEVSPDAIYRAFVEIINEYSRINSSDPRFNVGTFCTGKGFSKAMLLLKEDSLRCALIRRLQLPSSASLGDGRHQITIDLLKALDSRGILYRTHEGAEYSAENALWNVDFMSRPSVGAEPQKKSGWSAVIIIDPKPFPKIAQMEPYWWYAVIQRGTMGAARAVNKGKASITPLRQQKKTGNLLEAGEEELDAQLTQARSGFTVLSIDQLMDSPAEGPPPPEPATPAEPMSASAMEQEEDADEGQEGEGDSTENDEEAYAQTAPSSGNGSRAAGRALAPKPRRAIAPMDVKAALRRAVGAAKARGVALKEMNGRYLLSHQTLALLAPEIDWAGCRYKVNQMCTAGKIDAIFFPLGDDGYGLAVDIEDKPAAPAPQ